MRNSAEKAVRQVLCADDFAVVEIVKEKRPGATVLGAALTWSQISSAIRSMRWYMERAHY